MTLDEWMNLVVAEFPRPLQQHLRSEYRAHYQDHLEAGGSDDAFALFGDPAKTRKQLLKIYVTQKALELRPGVIHWLVGLLALMDCLLASRLLINPPYVVPWALPGLVMVPIGAAWLWKHTSEWLPERQTYFRYIGLALLFSTIQSFNLLSSGEPIFRQWLVWWVVLCMIGGVYNMLVTDARIRRTLDPTGGRRA